MEGLGFGRLTSACGPDSAIPQLDATPYARQQHTRQESRAQCWGKKTAGRASKKTGRDRGRRWLPSRNQQPRHIIRPGFSMKAARGGPWGGGIPVQCREQPPDLLTVCWEMRAVME